MKVFIEGKATHGHNHIIKCCKQTLSIIWTGKQDLMIKISKSHKNAYWCSWSFLNRSTKPKKSNMELCPIIGLFLVGHWWLEECGRLYVDHVFNKFLSKIKILNLYMFFHGYNAISFEIGDKPFWHKLFIK
jgi:hypothetical protein